MKFKAGDRVVVTKVIDQDTSVLRYIGQVFTIKKLSTGMFPVRVEEVGTDFDEQELELESIYNSPLYKALL